MDLSNAIRRGRESHLTIDNKTMNIKDLIINVREKFDEELKLKACELGKKLDEKLKLLENSSTSIEGISFVDERVFFMIPATFEKNMKNLHKINAGTKHSYTINSYYMCGDDLCVGYAFGPSEAEDRFTISFYHVDAEHALEKVSGGKCRITHQKQAVGTMKTVVCNLEKVEA